MSEFMTVVCEICEPARVQDHALAAVQYKKIL